ncbi:MAG TPA: tRNA pseudouridine(55) synthase TruB [Vicinamibacterales bacterium]|nr:tRNA pseudouridine(55) synthase TruB [Vicinamibacterales bacterium]
MHQEELHGVLVVHKPVGPTSHDVVACARRSLGISRIGHTGTLDPQASGVLPLVLGQATRLAQHLTGSDKEYLATILFGVVTDTYDAAGTVLSESDHVPTRDAVEWALRQSTGTHQQAPPLYSAKMVDGERSYTRAREGKPIQPASVSVTAHALELVSFEAPRATVRIRCSAGFYVRALAHDIGQALGPGAILDGLVRTEAAGFRLGDAVLFEALVTAPRAELRAQIQPVETLLHDIPEATLTSEGVRWAINGRELGPRELRSPLAVIPPLTRLLGPDGKMVGLAEPSKMPGFLHPSVIFSYN